MTKQKIPLKAGKLFILVILVLVAVPAFAQSVDTAWVRRYNGLGDSADMATAIAVSDSGNVYVTGKSIGNGTSTDYATIKYYPNGDVAPSWPKRYNGPVNEEDGASSLVLDNSNSVYVTGRSQGGATSDDCTTIKYYSDGDTAWVRRYDADSLGDYGDAITSDDSNNVYVTGWSWNKVTDSDYLTIKYYPNGDTAWLRRYHGAGNYLDDAQAIAVDGSGNVYVTGRSIGIVTGYDYATIKYYPNGDTAWVRRYNGLGNDKDEARAIVVDGSGNVYVTGCSIGSGTNEDYATVKYYPNGDTVWVRRYDGQANGSDEAYTIALDGLNNVYVTGYSESTGTYQDYATIKYASSGNELWVKKYNGPPGNGSDIAYAIAIDDSNNAYVTGISGGGPTSFDYATIKYYSNGDVAWVKRYNGPGNAVDYASAIALDDSGNVYVTGRSEDNGTDYDYATIKYVQFLCGDANKDGVVDVGDVVYLINYLFKSGTAPVPILKAGDASCDGVVDVGDVVYLINYLFKNGTEPCC